MLYRLPPNSEVLETADLKHACKQCLEHVRGGGHIRELLLLLLQEGLGRLVRARIPSRNPPPQNRAPSTVLSYVGDIHYWRVRVH